MYSWSNIDYNTVICLMNTNTLRIPDVCKAYGAYDLHSFKSRTMEPKSIICSKSQCKHQISILTGTFFAYTKLLLWKFVHFLYLWLSRTKISIIRNLLSKSSRTAANFVQYSRQLVINAIDKDKEVISDLGIIVEVNKSKFSKRKYHRRRASASKKWVFGVNR